MAPKPKPIDPLFDPLVTLFKSVGLSQSKAIEANKNPKSAVVLQDLIEKHNLVAVGLDEKRAVLVTAFAGNLSKSVAVGDDEKSFVVANILEGKLKSVDQVSGECNTARLCRCQLAIDPCSCDKICRISYPPY
jgi:glutaminyl-tRNA synthetase